MKFRVRNSQSHDENPLHLTDPQFAGDLIGKIMHQNYNMIVDKLLHNIFFLTTEWLE